MEIVQSWLVSISRYNFSKYEQRLLVAIVDACQDYFRKKYLKTLTQVPPPKQANDRMITIKMSALLDENDTHYSRIKAAVRELQSKNVQLYHPDTRIWESSPLIGMVSHAERSGTLRVTVPSMFMRALYDLRLGYSKYDLEAALSLQSPYAVRMYAIVAHQSRPLTMQIQTLKQVFGVVDKYAQTRDFIKRVIIPAQQALNDAHLPSFEFRREVKGQKVIALTFERIQPEVAAVNYHDANASDLQQACGEEIWNMLTTRVGFTRRELLAHDRLIRAALKLPCSVQVFRDIVHRFWKGNKTKGYVINALKSETRGEG